MEVYLSVRQFGLLNELLRKKDFASSLVIAKVEYICGLKQDCSNSQLTHQ